MKDKTDQVLYQEFLDGNKESFEQLVIRHKNHVIYFLYSYVHSIEIAEDITQDVFVYLLVHQIPYDFSYSFKTYLYTIGKSKALNYLKREKRIVPLEEWEIQDVETLEEMVYRKEDRLQVREDIACLKPEYQKVIYLADIEGFSYKEISEIMQKSYTNVKVLIHRARKSLEKVMRREVGRYEE